MKKSEQYTRAMLAVLDDQRLSPMGKLEVLESLMEDRRVAEYSEKQKEAEKMLQCPNCGEELAPDDYMYRTRNRAVIGCENCIETVRAEIAIDDMNDY